MAIQMRDSNWATVRDIVGKKIGKILAPSFLSPLSFLPSDSLPFYSRAVSIKTTWMKIQKSLYKAKLGEEPKHWIPYHKCLIGVSHIRLTSELVNFVVCLTVGK